MSSHRKAIIKAGAIAVCLSASIAAICIDEECRAIMADAMSRGEAQSGRNIATDTGIRIVGKDEEGGQAGDPRPQGQGLITLDGVTPVASDAQGGETDGKAADDTAADGAVNVLELEEPGTAADGGKPDGKAGKATDAATDGRADAGKGSRKGTSITWDEANAGKSGKTDNGDKAGKGSDSGDADKATDSANASRSSRIAVVPKKERAIRRTLAKALSADDLAGMSAWVTEYPDKSRALHVRAALPASAFSSGEELRDAFGRAAAALSRYATKRMLRIRLVDVSVYGADDAGSIDLDAGRAPTIESVDWLATASIDVPASDGSSAGDANGMAVVWEGNPLRVDPSKLGFSDAPLKG